MKLSQMFPSKYLQAEDLPRGQNTIVTIEKVYAAAARDRHGSDEPEMKYMIRFREFRKPMSLWRTTGKVIGDVLGTDETDQWVGRQIAIYPGTYVSYGETKPCVNVDIWKPEEVRPRAAATPSLVIAGDRRPVPKPAMDRFLSHLRGQGKGWGDFLHWVKFSSPDASVMVAGVAMEEIPAGVLPAMKAYLDTLQPALPGEQVDTATGEVTPARATVPAGASAFPPAPDPVNDDDIPF